MFNKLTTISFLIGRQKYKDMYDQIKRELSFHNKIFSYIIYNVNDKKVSDITTWRVNCLVSNIESYNTLSTDKITNDIITDIMSDVFESNIAGFKQPCSEILVRAYTPLVKSLSKYFSDKWNKLEYDDAYQICMMSIIELSNKNKYIHYNLMYKTFQNNILQYLRHDRDGPENESIYDDERLQIADQIADNDAIEQEERRLELDEIHSLFLEVQEMAIRRVGKEKWERICDIYCNKKKTDVNIRQELHRLKKYFLNKGITMKFLKERQNGS